MSISDGVHRFSLSCPVAGRCEGGTLSSPLNLGTDLTLQHFARAPFGACGDFNCQQEGAYLNFELFEADGTTPVNYVPITVAEPGAGSLLLLAIPATFWKLRRCAAERVALGE